MAKEIDQKICKSTRTYTDYLKNTNLNSLLLNPVTKSEIEKIINMFRDKKSVGPHGIPKNILKEYRKIPRTLQNSPLYPSLQKRINLTAKTIDQYLYYQI